MGNISLVISCASLVAGSLCLAFLGGPLDWALIAVFALPLGLHNVVLSLASVIIIRSQIPRRIASIFVIPEAGRAETSRPVFFKCKTTYGQIFPEKHAFDHSYVLVGAPVGREDRRGGIFEAKKFTSRAREGKSAWFDVRAEDHLHRGGGDLGLRGKLEAYLISEGIDPPRYPYAYLITAPRSLGNFFNPASMWYLYDEDRVLSAVIVELNNAFGERRMYFVSGDEPCKKLGHGGPPSELEGGSNVQQDPNVRYRFQENVSKDSRVSASSALDLREGPCSVETNDPLGSNLEGFRPLDVMVTLTSPKSHSKGIIKLFLLGDPLGPRKMTLLEKLGLILGWSWVAILTVARMVKEASAHRLHGLHVWIRPGSPREAINRRATASETFLEGVFRAYLHHLVDQSAKALVVRYIPSGTGWGPDVMRSPRANEGEAAGELEFQVLTPAFYTRFVHYAHDFEAVFAEFRESSTISVSNPELLLGLLLKKPPPAVSTENFADYIYFRAIRWLRRRPPPLRPRNASQSRSAAGAVDIRELRLSSMDGYVLAETPTEVRRGYRAAVVRVLFSSLLGGLSPEALQAGEVIVRAAAMWLLAAAAHLVLDRYSAG